MKVLAILIALMNVGYAEEKLVIGALSGEGLFSSFLTVISHLIWAEKNNVVPVVYWNKDSCYFQEEPYNGSFNPWEYYFEPVSHLSYQLGDKVRTCISAPDGLCIYNNFCHQRHIFFSTLRNECNEAFNKYVVIKPPILEKVRLFYEANMANKTTIGIHLRGTDRAGGKLNVEIKNEEMKARRDSLIDRKQKLAGSILQSAEKAASDASGDVQFFIATDDESLLELAKGVLTRPIVNYNTQRSKDGSPLHKLGPKKTGALQGEEVLIEALLLSRCDFLSYSLSCVAIGALIFNPNLQNDFVTVPYEPTDRKRGRRVF